MVIPKNMFTKNAHSITSTETELIDEGLVALFQKWRPEDIKNFWHIRWKYLVNNIYHSLNIPFHS